jgi:hypothetical protein
MEDECIFEGEPEMKRRRGEKKKDVERRRRRMKAALQFGHELALAEAD